MPTARELLEQADALMRRTRLGSGEAPARAQTPAAGAATVSPASGLPASEIRTTQTEPLPPAVESASSESSASAPDEAPTFLAGVPGDGAMPPDAPIVEPPPGPEAEFPLLTDAIDEPKAETVAPLDEFADVPVLTDAVEEIDVGIVDEAASGEPSIWEPTARGETSVLGPAPDSVVAVPPPESGAFPDAHLPSEASGAFDVDARPSTQTSPQSPGLVTSDDERGAEAIPAADEEDAGSALAWELDESSVPPSASPEPLHTPEGPDSSGDAQPAVREESRPLALAALSESESPAEHSPPVDARESPAALPVETPITLPWASELDQQRIREIAEEIGLQVLQRIDIFTDTTLRAQLGERLRPVVDRAAADLVAAINENVGELLRSYISEAIEREIQSWRAKER